ncbi:hypothetical protein GF407_16550 [candidate division KSB1 bacterium]|nr:hypothetical protein [candidate division KSB1 bacterium]
MQTLSAEPASCIPSQRLGTRTVGTCVPYPSVHQTWQVNRNLPGQKLFGKRFWGWKQHCSITPFPNIRDK